MFYLICISITIVLSSAHILDGLKPKEGLLGYGLRCSMCMGFWIGIALSFTKYSIGPFWVCGFVSSFTSYAAECVLNRIDND